MKIKQMSKPKKSMMKKRGYGNGGIAKWKGDRLQPWSIGGSNPSTASTLTKLVNTWRLT